MDKTMHTLLICTVGGTPEPIAKSLAHWRPARIVFIPSGQTAAQIDAVLRVYAEATGQPLSPGCYRIVPVDDAEDLDGCLLAIKRLDDEVADWLNRTGDYQVVADFTAGTKCMSAALALQARRWKCQFSYVGGASRTKSGVGIVESGSERVVHSANPWDALGFQAIEDFIALFNEQAYSSASRLANTALLNATSPTRKRELAALKHLADAYDAWDRFSHKAALQKLQDFTKFENDVRAALGRAAAEQLLALAHTHCNYLHAFSEASAPSSSHVADLLANARRRQMEGRCDDAVARLYRSIESIAQLALVQYGIRDTKHVPLERIPEQLRAAWASRAEDGTVFLGLQDAYSLLASLGNDLGAKFKELGLAERDRSPLTARNQSILAHGFAQVGEKVFQQLWDVALNLASINELALPKFPRIS
jgi:CRISPR-associated protein (TIGR02710 family)